MKKKTNFRDRDDLSTRDIGHFPKVSLSRRFHCSLIPDTGVGLGLGLKIALYKAVKFMLGYDLHVYK